MTSVWLQDTSPGAVEKITLSVLRTSSAAADTAGNRGAAAKVLSKL